MPLHTLAPVLVLAGLHHAGGAPTAELPPPLDFAAIPRTLAAEPKYTAEPRYGMFVFEPRGEQRGPQRLWLVLDKSAKDAAAYDVLYVDHDGDGTLGEPGERHVATMKGGDARFEIGELTQPGTDVVHTEFVLTWTIASVRFRMLWRGATLTMGGYGPYRETYAAFGASPEEATIYVPGYDRPVEFEHWMCDKLRPGSDHTFKVFVGARGSARGAFACGDEKLLPKGEYAIATLIYDDEDGKEQRVRAELHERC